MENFAPWSAEEGLSAEVFIAANFEENGGSQETLHDLEASKGVLASEERRTVEAYINALRPIYAEMIVRDFAGNTAGLYDGSAIYLDRSVPAVDASVEETIARAKEVYGHEGYHQLHRHTEPLQVIAETKDDIAAVIGGVEFTETALIEGLTVRETGDQFVSEEYLEYERMIDRAVARSERTLEDIKHSVNVTKNIAAIDDRASQRHDAETQWAVSI